MQETKGRIRQYRQLLGWLGVGAVCFGVFVFLQVTRAQNLRADYQLQNTRSSSIGGSVLADAGPGTNTFQTDTVDSVSRTVLRFPTNNGLRLGATSDIIPSNSYTIVMLFKVDSVSGFVRLVDFKNRTTDNGLYILNGQLENCQTCSSIAANTYVQVVYTRNSGGTFAAYVNGVLQGQGPDSNGDFVISASQTLIFFQDDIEFPNEASAGSVARIRLYDAPMTGAEVAALDRLPILSVSVTNTNDSGAGSLRQAILNSNAGAGLQIITFNIPGAGVHTISPASLLPVITDPVIIDGTTQPGFSSTPLIELNGANAGAGVNGLNLTAGDSTVRGLVINRFSGSGINIFTSGFNTIQGNYLGTNASGNAALGNGSGIIISDAASDNTIGGITAQARNVISGNTNSGISILGDDAGINFVQGNYIGTDVTGTIDVGNAGDGIVIQSPSNTIGGVNSSERNIISGNNSRGVFLVSQAGDTASGNAVLGNYIGVDVTGAVALGNSQAGVVLSGAIANVVGGMVSGSKNVVSGNANGGISLTNGSAANFIHGNYVGTNAAGLAAIPNSVVGVAIENSPSNIIGGTTPLERNVISGNTGVGLWIQGAASVNNIVLGNYIGTNANGDSALPNVQSGIFIFNGASGNTIGGGTGGSRNVISGNSVRALNGNLDLAGVDIQANNNFVIENFIGCDASGTIAIPNGSGISFSGSNNTATFNTIFGNTQSGVDISNGNGNSVVNNSIFSNGGIGIDLHGAANNSRAAPALTAASSSATQIFFQGTVTGPPNTTGLIQFFDSNGCDPSGSGEGQFFLGELVAQFDANGNAPMPSPLTGNVALGQFITATTTDTNNNTSEFSICRVVTAASTFNITGRVTDVSGNGVSGVSVDLNGANPTNTDGSGNYSFTNLAGGGNYTITPSAPGSSFAPTNAQFTNLNSNRVANFVATQTLVGISGTVTDSNNVPVNNVTISLTKNSVAAGTVQTNVLGNYSFPNQTVGANYVVTPTGSFVPSSQAFSNLTTNVGANFKSAPSIAPQCSDPSFGSANGITVGSNPLSVAASDFNNDGKVDLATANNGSNNVSVLLGTGIGTFSVATNFPAGTTPVGVVASDFNNDRNSDLAVANNGSNNVSILLGNGAGTFGAASSFVAGSFPGFIVTADLNGDGTSDLVVANRGSHTLSILLGLGNGGFSASADVPTDAIPQSLSVGDLNNDGRVDLIVANSGFGPNEISVFMGVGNGTFGNAINLALTSAPTAVGVADLDGDGMLDLVVPTGSLNTVSVRKGNGLGSFGVAVDFATGAGPNSVVIVDLNSDTKLDLVLTNNNSNNVSVLLGNGSGGFASANAFLTAGANPRTIAVNDFNGDGRADLAVANCACSPSQGAGNLSILLNTGSTCNSQTSLSISGQVKSAAGSPLPDVAVTLSGPITRVVTGDSNGNYSFPNLAPGGNYAVTVQSSQDVFAPSRADLFNLSSNQTVNFTAAPNVVPLPTPTPSDNFNSPTRDPERWNLGTQTQPVGAVDPQVTTRQVNGQLVITPRAQQVGLHYNGYVSASSFDFRNGSAAVELVKAASGGADSIFAIGSDRDNFTRFVVHTAGGPSGAVSMVRDAYGQLQPLDNTIPQLIFQVTIGGQQIPGPSIPYDPVQHRYLRFRHEAPTNAILFETSPNNIDFVERHRVTLQKSVSALTAELSAGTPNPTNPGQTIFDNFNLVTSTYQFSAANYTIGEGEGSIVITVTRQGNAGQGAATVEYSTTDGTAQQKNRYIPAVGTLTFGPGVMSRTFTVLVVDNVLTEGNQTVNLVLGNALGSGLNTPGRAVLTIVDNDTLATAVNPVDEAVFYAKQHYLDFFSREADASGLAFWANEITSCGADVQCREVKRINVSAAFFLSIEFQQTGYLVERIYKVAYGDGSGTSTFGGVHQLAVPIIRREEFLPDTQEIGLGVVVGSANWEQHLESNKVAFLNGFVQRTRFANAYANTLTPVQYVDFLFQHAGVTSTAGERTAAINEFAGAQTSAEVGARARVLRQVAEHATLKEQEFNRAFVLMQYFGYLRRNPNGAPDTDYTGYDFWLTKLNQFNGNFVNAEMVKAFITSGEYIHRFGP